MAVLNNLHIVPLKIYIFTCSGAPLLARCQFPLSSIYVMAVRLSTGLKGKKWTSLIPSLACNKR